MSETGKRVILYGYAASPFYQKTLNLLAHYRVPYDIVKTGFMPPRPMLSDELNITYRKIPVMALDGQLYVDTNSIGRILEETFGGKEGHGASLLQQQHVLQRKVTLHWFDQQLFAVGATLIPPKALTKEFLEDRASYGVKMGMVPNHVAKSNLREQLAMLEEQLEANEKASSSGPFLLGTKEPQHVDLGVYTALNWVQTMQKSAPEYLPLDSSSSSPTPFPRVVKLLAHIRGHLKQQQSRLSKPEILDPKVAAQRLTQAGKKAVDEMKAKGGEVDAEDPVVKAGTFRYGDEVEVTPTDTGRVPQKGQLVAYTTSRITLIVNAGESASRAPFLVHFPRSFFKVQRSQESSKL